MVRARAATSWLTWFCRSVRIAKKATAVMASATNATAPAATRVNLALRVRRDLVDLIRLTRSPARPQHVPDAPHVVHQPLQALGLEALRRSIVTKTRSAFDAGAFAVAPDPVGDHLVAEHLLRVADKQLEEGRTRSW